MEGMKEYPDKYFNLPIVDPPYGVKRDKGFEGFGGFGTPIARTQYYGEWDDKRPENNYFKDLLRVSINSIIFGGNFFSDLLPCGNHWVFWDKLNTMPTFGDGELIYTTIKRNSVKKITLEWNGLLGKKSGGRIHPTQKPVALYKWLLKNYAKPRDKILDTHFGSLSIGIACHDMGFDLWAYELDPEYFQAGKERLERHQQQMKLF
jgi:site-specific DNA-methyltransferase (adenine-specific)